jgi:D-3-phosphoglycerate dehydrogenase
VSAPNVAIAPLDRPDIAVAIEDAGGRVSTLAGAEALVWTGDEPELLARLLHPRLRWVQLCSAGVDTWLEAGVLDPGRAWTAAKGVGAAPMAEHVLCLMLAAARELPTRVRAHAWGETGGRRLAGTVAGIVGCGAVGEALIRVFEPLDVTTLALTRTGRAVAGAAQSYGPEGLGELVRSSDWIVIAAPHTAKTHQLIGRRELAAMRPHAWLVNVARGGIVDTDALLDALSSGTIGGAALDVTDPEPLPDGHPLWDLANVIITPHVATTSDMNAEAMCARVAENVRRFHDGEALIGTVDVAEGY